ncbi:hypothetical protein GOP47_0009849 [Adiantum capillus-veneris]|uniref:Uncharacterized protein n=1 Tax=Adiantum capillus-veneris TaxID=13818 RepID=A0A9D4ZHI5_ADICA|nr:hypothetical protein GOP47_0009849 [Adiantum capillus-veneris]
MFLFPFGKPLPCLGRRALACCTILGLQKISLLSLLSQKAACISIACWPSSTFFYWLDTSIISVCFSPPYWHQLSFNPPASATAVQSQLIASIRGESRVFSG